ELYREFLPDLVGELYVNLFACSLDPSDRARSYSERIEAFGSPLLARTTEMRMVELQHFCDPGDGALAGMPRYMKGEMMRQLAEDTIVGIAKRCVDFPTSRSIYEMGMLGGAMGDRAEMDAAVGMRNADYLGGFSMMAEPGESL